MKQFIVVRMEGKNAIPCSNLYRHGIIPPEAEDPSPTIFSLQNAEYYVNVWMGNTGVKYQTRPLEGDKNWQERENKRFASGDYIPTPWHGEDWVQKAKECAEHFTHISQADKTRIAYTDTVEKGERDVQTRVNPSKYLTKFYGKILSEQTIREWCARYKREYGADYELKFATEADDIERVYSHGPSSCMQGVRSVRVYAGPDLAVAYIERKGNITARVVVWPEKKFYCTHLYGDVALMTEALTAEGYTPNYHFQGARLTIWKEGGRLMLPSLEMARQGYDETKEYVVIR